MPVEDDNTSPELNPDKLDLYLEDFRKAIKSSPEIKELADREHLPHYSNLTASYFASMTDNNFVEFFFTFMKSGGDVQSGGERFAGRFAENITKNLEKFRQHIQSVFDNNFNVKNWWSKSNEFAGWGTGTRSIFLCRCFPSRFPILNSKSMEVFRALKVIGANTKQKNSKNPAYYESFRQDLLLLLNRYPELNFFKLDVFAEYLSRVFSLAPEKRTSTEEVKALFEKYFPDRINLDKITSLLCESIEAANSASANKWNISFHKKEGVIRLNVGQIEALAIYPDKIDLILDKNQLPKSLEQIGTPKAWGKSVKDSHLFYLDHNKVHLVDQNISASHVSLIRSASKTQLRESSQKSSMLYSTYLKYLANNCRSLHIMELALERLAYGFLVQAPMATWLKLFLINHILRLGCENLSLET